MQLFSYPRRKPVTSLIAALCIFALLLAGYQFMGGKRSFSFSVSDANTHDAAAGILAAQLADENLNFTGWAPAGAALQLIAQDKPTVTATADAEGHWVATMPVDGHAKALQKWKATWQQDGKETETIGQVAVYTAGKPSDSVYAWIEAQTSFALLLAPDIGEAGSLYLAVTKQSDDQKVIFAGRAIAGSLVQVYADNELIGSAETSSDGNWAVTPILKIEKKNPLLRFDELHGTEGVIERRSYNSGWQDEAANGDNTLLHNDKENLLIWKPEAGQSMPPDEMIAGQILPAQQAKSK